MLLALRVIIFLAGLGLIFTWLHSIIRIVLLPRLVRDPLNHLVVSIVWRVLGWAIRNRNNPIQVQQVMLWFFPISIMVLTATWFLLVMTGFAGLYWSVYAVDSWVQAFIASGSALSTLGFATPQNTLGQFIAIPEGAFGLGIVVFLFTFVPGFLSAMQLRHDRVNWLYARTDTPPSGDALIAWFYRTGQADALNSIWEDWEQWFRNLEMYTALFPVVAFIPSFNRTHFWVNAAMAVLDAAALVRSTMNLDHYGSVDVCLRAGVMAIQEVAAAFNYPSFAGQELDHPCGVPRAEFDAACQRLADAGIPLKADRNQAWDSFSALRVEYVGPLTWLAQVTMAPPQPWLRLAPSPLWRPPTF
jgi:hypothetical protein